MKNLNKAILIAMGMALPLSVMASADDDVTIRMMEINEHAAEAVTNHIELPEAVNDHARDHAANGLETAENHSNEMDQDKDHAMDNESQEHEMEVEREEDRERDMDEERDNRKDVEHEGVDREEVEREGVDDVDHGGDNTNHDFEAPGQGIEAPENDGPDNNQSQHNPN